jgi:hypothetical protein
MAPGSGGRSRAGAFQLPVCRRIVPTQRWGRNICRFAHERGSVAVTTCVSAHQPAPVSFRNQSPHADRPFRFGWRLASAAFRGQAIDRTNEATVMQTFSSISRMAFRPDRRHPMPPLSASHGRRLRPAWKCCETPPRPSMSPLQAEVAANGRQHVAADPIPR